MARGRVGLDIGSTAVRAAEVVMGSDPPALVRAGQVPLEKGAVENGEIRNVDAVVQALRDLWERSGFRTKQVTLGVGNQRVVVREVTVPSLPPKELQQSLPLQVQDLIPIPVGDAVLDFDVLSEVEQEGTTMLRLLVVAAQREMLTVLAGAAQRARLEPVGIDLVPFALIRAVGNEDGLGLEETEAGGEALVDVGADITNICVHERGVARFVRILPSGGGDVTTAVAGSLGITEDEAEGLKRGQSTSTPEVEPILHARVSTLVDEIRSSLDFYRAQSPGSRISRVVVTGGGSKMPGFPDILRERIGGRVEPGRAFSKVQLRLDMDEETMAAVEPVLAVSLGLALPQP